MKPLPDYIIRFKSQRQPEAPGEGMFMPHNNNAEQFENEKNVKETTTSKTTDAVKNTSNKPTRNSTNLEDAVSKNPCTHSTPGGHEYSFNGEETCELRAYENG